MPRGPRSSAFQILLDCFHLFINLSSSYSWKSNMWSWLRTTKLEKDIQCNFSLSPPSDLQVLPRSAHQGPVLLPMSYASSPRHFSCIYYTHAMLFPFYPQRITLYPLIYTVLFSHNRNCFISAHRGASFVTSVL